MSINIQQVQSFRARTGLPMMACKKALEETDGDEEKALEILRKRGETKAADRAERSVKNGVIACYIHSNKKVAAVVKLLCETDFVARNAEFQALAYEIAMHVTATNPQFIKPEEAPADFVAKEKEIALAQIKTEGKSADLADKIVIGKLKKIVEERALLTQPFIKDPTKTIGQLIQDLIAKIGENIQVGEIKRMEV